MNPPSFSQFYILHSDFLSYRKEGSENVKAKQVWRLKVFPVFSEFLLNDA